MSFNIGLSGMRAASKDLNVTGNNIANAGTVGFKQSRAEFSDVYAASVLGNGKNPVGSGVLLSNISQQFNQGNISYTQNALDLAINGNGFFQVSNNGALSYTRAGYFGTDRQGFLVDNFGYKLQGFPVDANGNLRAGASGDLQIQTNNQAPKATAKIDTAFNLNSTQKSPVSWQAVFNDAALTSLQGDDFLTNPEIDLLETPETWFDSLTGGGFYVNALRAGYSEPDLAPAHPDYADAVKSAIRSAMSSANASVMANSEAVASVAEAAKQVASETTFNPSDPTTYNSSTSVNIYDSQGNAHVMTKYFVKTGANTWDMNILINGRNPETPGSAAPYSMALSFDPSGALESIGPRASGLFTIDPVTKTVTLNSASSTAGGWVPAISDGGNPATWTANGALGNAEGMVLDFSQSTQYASSFSVNRVVQDGYTTGELAGLEIDDTGVIFARYTNGQSKVQGQIMLANFANVQGLTPVGKSQWVQSFESGEPVLGTPMSGTLGALQAGALEDSNVELSDQLVNLIVAQRNYQANAKTIETESAITQTLINMR